MNQKNQNKLFEIKVVDPEKVDGLTKKVIMAEIPRTYVSNNQLARVGSELELHIDPAQSGLYHSSMVDALYAEVKPDQVRLMYNSDGSNLEGETDFVKNQARLLTAGFYQN